MNQAKAASMRSQLELTREGRYGMSESVPCVVIVDGGPTVELAAAIAVLVRTGPEPAKSIPAIAPSVAPPSQPPVTAVVRANELSTPKD